MTTEELLKRNEALREAVKKAREALAAAYGITQSK